jgi:hypothetical protein
MLFELHAVILAIHGNTGIAFGFTLLFSMQQKLKLFPVLTATLSLYYVIVVCCVDFEATESAIHGNVDIAVGISLLCFMRQELKPFPVMWPPY